MCDLTVAAMALSLASSAAGAASASANATAQRAFQAQMAARNQASANAAAVSQYASIERKMSEERMKAGIAAQKVTSDAIMARSRVQAAGVESGATGASIDALLGDFSRQEGELMGNIAATSSFMADQAAADTEGARMGLEGRLLASTPDYIPEQSPFATMLGGVASAFSSGIAVAGAQVASGGTSWLI